MSLSLLADFHQQNTFQFGEFTLKSGQSSPIYIDLRSLISSPSILENAARELCNLIKSTKLEFDYIIGVPYGAIIIATLVSNYLQKPLLLKRKEAKVYGKKNLIEGIFDVGKKVIVIEDVVTTGSSILETVQELRNANLICEHVFSILDREQGGLNHLQCNNVTLHSLFLLTNVLDFLVQNNVITEMRKNEIQTALTQTTIKNDEKNNTTNIIELKTKLNVKNCENESNCSNKWNLTTRQLLFNKNLFNKRLIEIILKKKTNLCFAADFDTTEKILFIVDKIKDYICALKLHYDIIKDFNKNFVTKLQQLSNDYNFIIFEDRKLADTGKTIQLQIQCGELPIIKWADIITVHSIVGSSTVRALDTIIKNESLRLTSCLLIAELSTENSLTKLDGYVKGTIQIAKENLNLVSGFICQKRCFDDPSFIYWTPGVNLNNSSDGSGQQWRSVEQAIINDGCDVIIVGRGISSANDVAAEACRYAQAGWAAFSKRDL